MSYESVLCVIRECFVYKIPPRTKAAGYKAADWDVNQFLWTGRLRVIAVGDNLALHLEDATNGELFAKSPIEKDGSGIEQVTDSSRYFVIKVVDPSTGQHAFVGLGFQERSYAFDMNVAIQDHLKRLTVVSKPNVESNKPVAPPVDYSLKEGQSISISIGGLNPKPAVSTTANNESSDFSKFFIPPPPSNSNKTATFNSSAWNSTAPQPGNQPSVSSEPKWDDFGDFNATSGKPAKDGWTSFQ